MARMYAKRKGKSGSTKPHNESLPEWSNTDAKAVTELVVELGKAGHSSAQSVQFSETNMQYLTQERSSARESLR